MPKRTKIETKQNEPSLMVAFETEIRSQLADIQSRRAKKDADLDKIMLSTAALTRSMVSLEGERRQKAKQEHRVLESFSYDQIVTYLRSLPPATREQLSREIAGLDDEEPVL